MGELTDAALWHLAADGNEDTPLVSRELTELRGVTPPKSEQNTVEEWLAQSEVLSTTSSRCATRQRRRT